MKLISKLILIIIIISFIPIWTLTLFSFNKGKKILNQQIINDLHLISELAEQNLTTFLNDKKIRSADWSSDGHIRLSTEAIIKNTDEHRAFDLGIYIKNKKHPLADDIIETDIIDLSGKIIASTEEKEINKYIDQEKINIKNTRAAQFGETFISKVVIESEEGHMDELMFHITTPIISIETNKTVGILINHIRVKELNKILTIENIIKSEHPQIARKAWQTLEIYIVNDQALLTTPASLETSAVLKQKIDTMPVNTCLEKGESYSGFYKNYAQKDVLGISTCLGGPFPILIVEVNSNEALAPLANLRQNTILLIGAITFLTIFLIWLLGYRMIIKRIFKITKIIDEFSKGNFDYKTSTGNHDEISATTKKLSELGDRFKYYLREIESSEEQKYKKYLDLAGTIIIAIDKNQNIKFANKKAAEILEYEENEIIGKNWFDNFIPEKYRNDVKNIFDKLMNKKLEIAEYYENPVITKTGKEKIIAWHNIPLLDEQKNIIGTVSSGEDVTERKKIENALKESEEKFKALFESAPEAMIITTRDDKIIMANIQAEKLFGYNKDELIGKSHSALIPEKFRQKHGKNIGSYFINPTIKKMSPDIEAFALRKDGAEIPIEISLSPIELRKEIFALVVARDITEKKNIENKIKQLHKKYQNMIDSLPICIKLFNETGKMTYINKYGMEEHSLKNEEEALKWDYLDTVETTYKEDTKKAMANALKGTEQKAELKHTLEGSTHEYCESWLNPLKDESGNITGVVMASADITERKKIIERTKELDFLKNKFIQIVSHQMRTPLNAIRWSLETILNKTLGKITSDQENMITASYGSTLEIIDRIDDLITALDIEESKVRLEFQESYLDSLAQSSFIEYNPKIKEKKLKVDLKFPKIKTPINIDPAKIKSVITKLLDNAIKYTRDGGEIKIEIEEKDKEVFFAINDTGIGIPADDQNKIFNKFYRASNAILMLPDSSGLGLFISKAFIEAHGGKIWLNSQEGVGSTFYFKLPVKINK